MFLFDFVFIYVKRLVFSVVVMPFCVVFSCNNRLFQ